MARFVWTDAPLRPEGCRVRPLAPAMESIGAYVDRMNTGRIASRPTVRGGVTFRSRLEARFSSHLDQRGERWAYEPRVFGRRGRGYLPDFEILGAVRPTFIEVKPTLEEVPAAQKKAAVIWDELPDALIIVVVEESCAYFASLKGGPWETWQELWK